MNNLKSISLKKKDTANVSDPKPAIRCLNLPPLLIEDTGSSGGMPGFGSDTFAAHYLRSILAEVGCYSACDNQPTAFCALTKKVRHFAKRILLVLFQACVHWPHHDPIRESDIPDSERLKDVRIWCPRFAFSQCPSKHGCVMWKLSVNSI